jgi:hypothetical protein
MPALNRAAVADDVLLWLHGRRVGIVGDGGQTPISTVLVLDNKAMLSLRAAAPLIVSTVAGHNGAGAVTVAGVVAGDTVVNATDLTAPGDVSSSFEGTVSVSGQVQQSSATDLHTHQIMFHVWPRS